jgi:sodium/bile acid cotransporter 7
MDRLASKGGFMQGTGFALALVMVALVGVFFPDPFSQSKWGQSGQWASVATFIVFIFQGRSLSLKGLWLEFKRPVVTLVVQGGIFFLPWIVATILFLCSLSSSSFFIGFLVVLVLPSTISSCVVYAREAGGNAEFALGHSFLSNFIAPFVFPLLSGGWLYGVGYVGVSFFTVVEQIYPRLGLLIILPAVLGYLSKKIPILGEPVGNWERKVPQGCILFLSYIAFASGTSLGLLDQSFKQWVELIGWIIACWLMLSFLGWVCGAITAVSISERKSIYFVVSQKSIATGIPLVFAMMGTETAQSWVWIVLPLSFYHLFQLLAGAGMVAYLNRKASE